MQGKNDIQIVDTYIDRALSAKTDNRPSFQKMVKDSVKSGFQTIIVWKLDRFAVIVMTQLIINLCSVKTV